ncbi:hypothetical protein EHI8A_064680 [Entamoeba histolytica HM-1:IMSS-B]|uniref:Uncharacterized protein n=6 Tax=Entamoeba histolytica TaxID=5759 RepID=C4M5A6_ENTH1|nr:hypothetical protein EHI_081380 [Entamoeba histolytica HM-1:IMSS]EMD42456.1 Hypothetical protein EHI5A_058680 [Entamoeba histolytica KU27]EMH72948.1 hypothetical protein EHI8A_064680 [Entamoeba histolytica HM-1:IMSS-B]EMS15316.1 hypothetical protein KM1_090660 [Entamoeba histolytica HM-3:IMSS]ENY64832.1 hypothetical protein EHI7A_061880 [Entamoeba histolytica HM-1:IMSS-A]GAT96609.1 hypothetical protein CL6EHI_081380 [Entamoeba histolytica]|eukprot:XP_656800.2 hypothetical protein EHI_081380 [Entamoeba histolytica HM-1:IMSS]
MQQNQQFLFNLQTYPAVEDYINTVLTSKEDDFYDKIFNQIDELKLKLEIQRQSIDKLRMNTAALESEMNRIPSSFSSQQFTQSQESSSNPHLKQNSPTKQVKALSTTQPNTPHSNTEHQTVEETTSTQQKRVRRAHSIDTTTLFEPQYQTTPLTSQKIVSSPSTNGNHSTSSQEPFSLQNNEEQLSSSHSQFSSSIAPPIITSPTPKTESASIPDNHPVLSPRSKAQSNQTIFTAVTDKSEQKIKDKKETKSVTDSSDIKTPNDTEKPETFTVFFGKKQQNQVSKSKDEDINKKQQMLKTNPLIKLQNESQSQSTTKQSQSQLSQPITSQEESQTLKKEQKKKVKIVNKNDIDSYKKIDNLPTILPETAAQGPLPTTFNLPLTGKKKSRLRQDVSSKSGDDDDSKT